MAAEFPLGFRAAGAACGLKRAVGAPDISLVVSDVPATAVGVYTQNRVCAAPVELDRQRTPSERVRAVITNSGNANACTGRQGWENANSMARLTAGACGVEPTQVLVMSTGIIGHQLDMEKVAHGIQQAASELGREAQHVHAAARGMMTTDTVEKIASRQLALSFGPVRILGFAWRLIRRSRYWTKRLGARSMPSAWTAM